MQQNFVKLPLVCSVICLVAAVLLPAVSAISCAGCVDLDDLNFNRTIVRFPYAIVKFDIAFPYGEKHEAFAEFSKAAHLATDELMVATVGIKDYGEMENKELGLRYDAHEKNLPVIILFSAGNLKDFIRFPMHLDVTVNNLKKFVTDNSELYIGRDGCLKEFNALALNYANLADEEQQSIIAKTYKLAKQLTKEADKTSAKTYRMFMQKINEKGYNFVEEETKRLLRLKAGKVSEAKKNELTLRLNILECFRVNKLTKQSGKAEL